MRTSRLKLVTFLGLGGVAVGCAHFPGRMAETKPAATARLSGATATATAPAQSLSQYREAKPVVRPVYVRGTSELKVSVDDPNFFDSLDEALAKVKHEKVTLSTEALKALVRSEKGRRMMIRDLSGQLEAIKNIDVQEASAARTSATSEEQTSATQVIR